MGNAAPGRCSSRTRSAQTRERALHRDISSVRLYWSLRDYKLPPQIWGGDPRCEHVFGEEQRRGGSAQKQGSTSQRTNRSNVEAQERANDNLGAFCSRCNAFRGQLGLEPTIDTWCSHLVEIFEEVKRILHPLGSMWLNCGDSWACAC